MLAGARRLARPLTARLERALARWFPVARQPGAFLAEPGTGALAAHVAPDAPTLAEPGWQLVTAAQYREPAYLEWCGALRAQRQWQRKQWEWIYILEVLRRHGMLQSGRRGLGFGCGQEPIAALAARHGCAIVATDLARPEALAAGWAASGQNAVALEDLNRAELCEPAAFADRVTFRTCDMNAIPDDLAGFDFAWSSCALEHLGGLEAGLRFVERAMRCLRPGGIAVHTTEFNLGSNDRTIDRPGVAIYRRRDLEALATRLLAAGHFLPKIHFTAGAADEDLSVDLPPYRGAFHLRLQLRRHLVTSVGLFAIAG